MSDQSTSTPSQPRYDVVILGGGLAGLTLALQVKQARAETSVFLAEKRSGPAPEATFKVGESTSESGAHYLREVVGLGDHLHDKHLAKMAIRFFYPAGDNSDIAKRVEWGIARTPLGKTYQLDRGRLENELADRCRAAGVELAMGAFIDEIDVGTDGTGHAVTVVRGGPGGERSRVEGRWLVDASGRSSLLKRKLGMEKVDLDHHINSAWFRIEGSVDVEEWSDDPEWLGRMPERGMRKLSTVHLTGEGYWVWMIQLPSGPHSIGVVADPRFHPFDQINEFDRLLEWFSEHEPQLAASLEPRRDRVLDFLSVEDFAYSCERVYSTDRWCLTGEAGAFLDPLYSPGSDFIGYGNTFITDMITRDLAGEDIQNRIEFFNFLYFQLLTPGVYPYRDQYHLFGNPQVMLAKVLYENLAYFCGLAFPFIQGRLHRPEVMFGLVDVITQRAIPLLGRLEDFFREWHALDHREWQGVSVLMQEFTLLFDVQKTLFQEMTDEEFADRFRKNVDLLDAVAVTLFHWAARQLPDPPGEDVPINPRAISLQPERWEEDGLFSEDGMSLERARELLPPGMEEFLLEKRGAALPVG
jgi:flavin-dependent dehydrogenase